MGQTTPNIGIFIPAAGETNYDANFLAGMINIDQHDHSGGPNKGLPITGSGIAQGSITFDKLNSNVADTATGIGTHTGGLANQLMLLGILPSIFNIPTNSGFIAKDGTNASARTLTSANANIEITNPAGIIGDPVFTLANSIGVSDVNGFSGTLSLSVSGSEQVRLTAQTLDLGTGANNVAIFNGRVATGGIAPAASTDVTGFILSPNQIYLALSAEAAGGGSNVGQITLVSCGATLGVEDTLVNVLAGTNPTLSLDTTTGQVSITNNLAGASSYNIAWLRLF